MKKELIFIIGYINVANGKILLDIADIKGSYLDVREYSIGQCFLSGGSRAITFRSSKHELLLYYMGC
jgi:hypothetical protein